MAYGQQITQPPVAQGASLKLSLVVNRDGVAMGQNALEVSLRDVREVASIRRWILGRPLKITVAVQKNKVQPRGITGNRNSGVEVLRASLAGYKGALQWQGPEN